MASEYEARQASQAKVRQPKFPKPARRFKECQSQPRTLLDDLLTSQHARTPTEAQPYEDSHGQNTLALRWTLSPP